MICDDVRSQLTAYLDGDLADDRGSAVRGHLRTCAACRQIAADEGALRDGLRQLPPVDPPTSLWAGVQAQLAAAEMADAEKPAWKRTLARWSARVMPAWPQLALGGVVAAAVVAFLVWRARGDEPTASTAPVEIATPAAVPAPAPPPAEADDVTADLQGEAERVTQTYADAAEELLALATEARGRWSEDQRATFDTRVAELRGEIDRAAAGRAEQKAWRALIRYLQTAAVRDEVAYASGGVP